MGEWFLRVVADYDGTGLFAIVCDDVADPGPRCRALLKDGSWEDYPEGGKIPPDAFYHDPLGVLVGRL